MATTQNEGWRAHWKCFAACTLITMCPFQYGVDFGLIGGLQAMRGFLMVFGFEAPKTPLGWNLSAERQQLISSLMVMGAFLSSSAVGLISTYAGRKQSLWAACALCCVANIIMMTTTNIGALYAGRLLIGLANGMLTTFSQLYLQESTPAKYRGLFLTFYQFWTSIGSLIGAIVDNFTSKIPGRTSYLIPLGLIFVVPAFISVGMLFIPESPRWLLLNGKTEEARASLLWLRPNEDMVNQEMAEIEAALGREKELSQGVAVLDMFRNPIDRRRTILSVCAISTQAASGAMYLIAFGTYFYGMAKIKSPFEMSCILTAIGVLSLIANATVVSRYGRRRVFLITGLLLCGISQLGMAIVYDKQPGTIRTGRVLISLLAIYKVAYNGLISSYAWVAGGELPSQRLRSYTFGLASALGFFGAWLTTFTAPYFINPSALNWGPKYGYIWAPSCVLTATWVFFCLPEARNRTLEEIDEMFEAKLPARKFRHYTCTRRAVVLEKSAHDELAESNELSDEKKTGKVTTSAV